MNLRLFSSSNVIVSRTFKVIIFLNMIQYYIWSPQMIGEAKGRDEPCIWLRCLANAAALALVQHPWLWLLIVDRSFVEENVNFIRRVVEDETSNMTQVKIRSLFKNLCSTNVEFMCTSQVDP